MSLSKCFDEAIGVLMSEAEWKWKMFKVNNKEERTTPYFIVKTEHVFTSCYCLLSRMTLKKLPINLKAHWQIPTKMVFMWQSMTMFSFIEKTLELFRKTRNWRKICKQISSTFNISDDLRRFVPLRRVEKKKLLRRINKDISLKIAPAKYRFNYF